MKKLKIVILTVMVLLVTACNGSGTGNDTNKNLKNNIEENLYVIIDNVKYELDTECYSTFSNNGWKFEEKYVGKQIDGYDTNKYSTFTSYIKLENANYDEYASISVMFKNDGANIINIENTKIDYISYNSLVHWGTGYERIQNQPTIILPGNLKIGSTKEEVESVFGKPDNTYNSDGVVYSYGNDYTKGYIKFNFVDGFGLSSFEMYKNINL